MGLLVTDTSIAEFGLDAVRVLKVAVHDSATGRLADEAKVLSGIRHPRLVPLSKARWRSAADRPSCRKASATRPSRKHSVAGADSLDLLERWGGDLLEALVALDRSDSDHRDIKPANLGVRERRGDHRSPIQLVSI